MCSNEIFQTLSKLFPTLSTNDLELVLTTVGNLGTNSVDYDENFILKASILIATSIVGIREAEEGNPVFMDNVVQGTFLSVPMN